MKRSGKKLAAWMTTLTLAASCIGAAPLQASAAAYDAVGTYTPEEPWSGRASNAAMATIGDRMYAYVGRMTAGNDGAGGLTVLDVTNPKAPVEVQTVDSAYIDMGNLMATNEKLYVKDGYLIVRDTAHSAVEVYNIHKTDGTIDEDQPVAQLQDGFVSGRASLSVHGNYLFVVGQNATKSMRVYDIANPAQIKEIPPQDVAVSPAMATQTNEQIATFTADYDDLGNGVYRMYATNRVKLTDGADVYLLSIRDITIADGKYTVETLYEGQPEGTAFAGTNSSNVNDVDVVGEGCIAVVDGAKGNGVYDLELIDVSNPANPRHMAYGAQDFRGTAAYVDGDCIIVGSQDNNMAVYKVAGEAGAYTLEPVKQITTPYAQSYESGVYAGYLYVANNGGLCLYEYKNGIAIDNAGLEAYEATVTGTIDGYLPGDVVEVKINGTVYTAQVQGPRFYVEITDHLSGNTVMVTAQLKRDGAVLATDEQTLPVTTLGNIAYNDVSALNLSNTIQHETGGRATDAIGLTRDGKKFLYVYTSAGLVVYDMTDPELVQEVQRVPSVNGKIYNSQMQLKDGYLIVLNAANGNKVEFYKIGADGKIPETPTWTIGAGNSNKESTIEIVDEYLFEAQHGTGGKQLNVYDVSDIDAGVTKIGNTETNTGVHALEIQKFSDALYRLYYIARSDADGWKFCINDMTVTPEGGLQFDAAYPAVTIDAGLFSTICDIAYIGNNNVFLAFGDMNKDSYIFNVQGKEVASVTPVQGRSLSVIGLDGDYYAVGVQEGAVRFYNKQNNAALREFTGHGQVYNLATYDGKLIAVGESAVYIYDGLYTAVYVDGGTIDMSAKAAVTGVVEGYQAGDRVEIAVGDAPAAPAEIDAGGSFTFTFAPQETGPVSVVATLYRNEKRFLAAEQTVLITDPYMDIPEYIYDTNMTIQSMTTNANWSSSNRQTSLAITEINGRYYAYTGSFNNLMVYDITDPANPALVQENDIHVVQSNAYNKALAVKDGCIFTGAIPEGKNWQNIDVYALGADGKLADAPVASLNTGYITGLAIVDQYLFAYCNSSSGIEVYDISDVGNIQKIGTLGGVEQARAFCIEKLDSGMFRTYFVERTKVDGADDWHLAIYDIAVADGAAVFTNRYKGAHDGKYTSVKDIIKVDGDTIAVADETQNSTLNFYNVSNPENPVLEQQAGIRTQTALSVSGGEYLVVGTPEGSAGLLPQGADAASRTVALNCGNVYQIAEYRGNLVFACLQGLVIASMKTEFAVDSTTVSGTEPVLSGDVNGYAEGDVVKAVIGGAERTANVENGRFTISLAGLFEETNEAHVQLILERAGEPVIAKGYTVQYAGAYAYAVSSVDVTDGITVIYEKTNSAYADAVDVYVAIFEDNALIGADVQKNVTTGGVFTTDLAGFNAQTQTIRVLIWDADQKPVAAAYSPVIAEVAQNF